MSKMPDPYTGFIAGGLAGGIAAFVTSPLEVMKTRLQSNVGQQVIGRVCVPSFSLVAATGGGNHPAATTNTLSHSLNRSFKNFTYFKHVLKTEGGQAFFKGISPTLVGSMPTRAIYFGCYSKFKQFYGKWFAKDSANIFLFSAISAGVVTSSATSPIWVVKTQMQLNDKPGLMKVGSSIRSLYRTDGVRAFYRGLSASYVGSLETALHFLIYEKMKLITSKNCDKGAQPIQCMFIAAGTKTTASLICYPHEVCRTRLRQEAHPSQRKYHSFLQTLLKIWQEEGKVGLYGGLTAHLLRAIPNTAIIFFSYEAIVRVLDRYRLSY